MLYRHDGAAPATPRGPSRRMLLAGAAAAVALGGGGATLAALDDDPGPSTGRPGAGSGGQAADRGQPQRWVAANEADRSQRPRDGRADARHFDLLTAQAGTYGGQVPAMRAVSPQVRVLGYTNAVFAQEGQADAYDQDWYARDASGRQIRSVSFGNVLMDPTHEGWVADRIDFCTSLVRSSGYAGCMLDVMGVAPTQPSYTTSSPVRADGRLWTPREWLHATAALGARVKRALGDALVIGNGLDGGTRYFDAGAPSSVLLEDLDGGVAEGWFRRAREPLDARRSEQEWNADVRMLVDAARRGSVVMVLPKAWAEGPQADKDRVHEMAMATYLMGCSETTYFGFSDVERGDPGRVSDLTLLDVGNPTSRMSGADGVYRREFSRGLAVVNVGDRRRSVSLGSRVRAADGSQLDELTLAPYSGRVLVSAD